MKEFKYKILNPGGNKTALVIGNDYLEDEKKKINDIILEENTDVEQVGFLSSTKNRLDMAGGEFCVNATRCAIWHYLNGKREAINIEVSGIKETIEGWISKDNLKKVYAKLSINKSIENLVKKEGIYNLVYLDGITHAVINEADSREFIENLKQNEEQTKQKLKSLMKKIKTKESAVGIILTEKNKDTTRIYPIVWVKPVDTVYYETACGSGSLAAGIYNFVAYHTHNHEIMQPSGYSINVEINEEAEMIESAVISGIVIGEGKLKNGKL